MYESNLINNKESNIERTIKHRVYKNNKVNIVNNNISSDVNYDNINNENEYNTINEDRSKCNIRTL